LWGGSCGRPLNIKKSKGKKTRMRKVFKDFNVAEAVIYKVVVAL